MFNNPFLKNDSLLEAVKNAQLEGEYRRQAEKIVNEEFGVYSRKAVVREDLAAYDAALETTYNQLKEGWEGSKEDKTEDKKLAKDHGMTIGQWEKSRADKKHDAKEKQMKEELAKKDYDRDGKKESPKDEVWGSRFRAAKLAGKMEEEQIDELTKPTAKTAMKAYYRAYDSDVRSGEGERSSRLGRWKQKHLPGKSARNQKNTGKAELPDYSEKDSGYVPTVKKSGKLMKPTEKATKRAIKDRLGKHTKPKHLPEEVMKESIVAKLFAKHMKEQVSMMPSVPMPPRRPASFGSTAKPAASSRPGIVSKSDLDTYRTNVGNKNATLGQYMNDLKGKTAVAGGANDPTKIQSRLNAQSMSKSGGPTTAPKAFDPTERNPMITGRGQTGGSSNPPGSSTGNVTPTGGANIGPNVGRTSTSLGNADDKNLIGSVHQGGAGLDNSPKPSSQASSPPVSSEPKPTPTSAPEDKKKQSSTGSDTTVATESKLNESVQIGVNRYRIV